MIGRKFLLSACIALMLTVAAIPSIAFAQDDVTPEATTPAAPTETPETYVVQPGETLSQIATRFNLDLTTLLNLNPEIIDRPEWGLYPNETIRLLAATEPAATATEAPTTEATNAADVTSVAPAVENAATPSLTDAETPAPSTVEAGQTVATAVTPTPAPSTSVDGSEVDAANQTLLTILSNDDRFTTFVSSIERTAFADLLKNPGDLTVFAPTNAAFQKLTAQQTADMLGNAGLMENTLGYHVIAGGFDAAALIVSVDSNGHINTINGDTVRISSSGGIAQVNGNTLAIRDIRGSNGVLHIVDTVLNPAQKELLTGPSEGSLVSTTDSTAPASTPVSVSIPTTVAIPATPDAPEAEVSNATSDATVDIDAAAAEPVAEEETPAIGGAEDTAAVTQAAQPSQLGGDTYVIQSGDSLRTIAARSSTSVAYLLALNPELNANPDVIYPGRSVRLSGPLPGAPFGTTSYLVQQFDTLGKIAARYGTTIDEMVKINPQLRQRQANIYIGEIINVPG